MLNIYVAANLSDSERETLCRQFPGCSFSYDKQDLQKAKVVFGNPHPEQVSACEDLRWLQTCSAGVDPYMPQGSLPETCVLTNATGAYGLAISEYLLAAHLCLIRKLHLYRDAQREAKWQDLGPVTSIKGSTVLVLGLGDIGGSYARLVKAMGAYVIGVRRTDLRLPDYADEIYLTADLPSLLPRADAVVIALPGTAQTRGLLGREEIAQMKLGAILLNVGRGAVVDTEALCDALEQGRIGGAALDVTDPEPLPREHRLWKISNAIVTPHISGGYHLAETGERIFEIFTQNLCRYLKGEPLLNSVDKQTGYRKIQYK